LEVISITNKKFNNRRGKNWFYLLTLILIFGIVLCLGSFPTNQLNNQQENSDGIQLEASSYSYISVGDKWTINGDGTYYSYQVATITPTSIWANRFTNGIFQSLEELTSEVLNDEDLDYMIIINGIRTAHYGGKDILVTGPSDVVVVDVGTGIMVKTGLFQFVSWDIPLQLSTAPVLQPITPNPTNSSVILLEWNNIDYATDYYIYRSDTTITSTVGMTAIGSSTSLNYKDIITVNDEYFYAVTAGNVLHNSTNSNCESVVVEIAAQIPGFELLVILNGLAAVTIIFLYKKQNYFKNWR